MRWIGTVNEQGTVTIIDDIQVQRCASVMKMKQIVIDAISIVDGTATAHFPWAAPQP